MGPRIIIVDDDRDYLDLVRKRLQAAGFASVDALDDSVGAAALFEAEEAFDLALIDVGMPELDGRGLLEAIKKHSPGTECIMVTAVNDARTRVRPFPRQARQKRAPESSRLSCRLAAGLACPSIC